MNNEDDLDLLIAELTNQGFIEPIFHEDGTVGVKIVPGDDNPLWQAHISEVNETIAEYLERGYIEIAGVNDQGEWVYQTTDLGQSILDEEG